VTHGEKQVLDTDTYIVNFINDRLHIQTSAMAISQSHIVGKINEAKGTCQIIRKFVRYNTRRLVFQNKSLLKGSRIYISEDLTPLRYKVYQGLVDFRKRDMIVSVWSSDGRILYKCKNSPAIHSVNIYLAASKNIRYLLEPQRQD
jgi:hypothetical protein